MVLCPTQRVLPRDIMRIEEATTVAEAEAGNGLPHEEETA
jgi:hypothetical protein